MNDRVSKTVSKTNRWWHLLANRPRLWFAVLVAVGFFYLVPDSLIHRNGTRFICAWNVGAILYLLLAVHMMFFSTHERMRQRAIREDDGRLFILLMVVLAAITCIGSIFAELAVVKNLHGNVRVAHIALAGLTIATSWFFTQIMFALHYAHDYYLTLARTGDGGLVFPGGGSPDYTDFLYFAAVIGTSGQTADVSFSSRAMRRTGTLHCILAFFFNTTVIALTINIASSLV